MQHCLHGLNNLASDIIILAMIMRCKWMGCDLFHMYNLVQYKIPYINILALTVRLVIPFPTYFTQMKQNNKNTNNTIHCYIRKLFLKCVTYMHHNEYVLILLKIFKSNIWHHNYNRDEKNHLWPNKLFWFTVK